VVLRVARYGALVKQQSKLEGAFRTAHQRLIQNSEEIAFYGGAERERRLINESLANILKHAAVTRRVRFFVNLFDEFLVKYWATIAGYATMSVPMFVNADRMAAKTPTEMTRDYALLGRYLGNLADSIGQLVMMMSRLAGIAGYTARVDELLTKVDRLNSKALDPFPEMEEEKNGEALDKKSNLLLQNIEPWLAKWGQKCDGERASRVAQQKAPVVHAIPNGGQFVIGEGNIMKFEHVDIVSPEGRLLIRDLNFAVDNENVMVTGPNGAGKSSLFRIIGELWPLAKGTVTKPNNEDILFVPQKPYLVSGTFRDQIIYPHDHARMLQRNVTDDDLRHFMAIVDPSNKMVNTWSMDTTLDWFHAFSGGQKQRIAMARLFYHRPKYAILDECTSAVSSEVEDELYATCAKIGITLFTVSHRDYLKRHHAKCLTFVGEKGAWLWQDISQQDKERIVEQHKNSLSQFGGTH
jgi:ATP-binding cassette subfamily D (ALD) protein 3